MGGQRTSLGKNACTLGACSRGNGFSVTRVGVARLAVTRVGVARVLLISAQGILHLLIAGWASARGYSAQMYQRRWRRERRVHYPGCDAWIVVSEYLVCKTCD